ncbi:MAG TPA: hypothetical protein VL181_10425 [Holophagaceae bacterium]|nr:hypothetical protein [Holophagaceae bacterium]
MAVQPIKLSLVPEPSLWRARHLAVGWAALALGAVVFFGAAGYTAWSYHRASQAGQAAVNADAQTRFAATQERQLLDRLQQIDVDQELPRWRLAERILSERAAPWSRLAAELEQCLVDGSRVKNVERARAADQALLLKVKAEARTREAEAGFIEALRKDPVFTQVALEREAQEPGGGWEFDLSLPVAPLPPPFVAASAPKASEPGGAPAPSSKPLKPAVTRALPPPRPAPAAPLQGPRPAPAVVRRPQRGVRP